MKLTVQCWEPVQAHNAMTKTIWPQLKNALMAGHKMVLEIKPATRSLEQNSRLWAMLSEISEQVDWYGRKLTEEEWKHVFTAALKKQEVVPGLDGGFVVLGQSTRNMTKAEMSDLHDPMRGERMEEALCPESAGAGQSESSELVAASQSGHHSDSWPGFSRYLDAMSGVIFKDDTQVIDLHVKKVYSAVAGVNVMVMEVA